MNFPGKKTVDPGLVDRCVGSALAGAFGDSLGAGVEFASKVRIVKEFGPIGPSEPLGYRDLGAGSITDDTQQTLAVCQGLVHGVRRGATLATLREDVWFNLKQWASLQSDKLYNRAPGHVSLDALKSSVMGSLRVPLNDATTCGAVMRGHPVGFLRAGDPDAAFRLGVHIGVLTHGGANAYGPAALLAAMIAQLVVGQSLETAVKDALGIGRQYLPAAERSYDLLEKALSALVGETPIEDLGLGWEGDEALAMAVFAVRSYPAVDELPSCCGFAATHDGDSDSVASIAGAMHGAMHGERTVPSPWNRKLERASELRQRAEELVGFHGIPIEDL